MTRKEAIQALHNGKAITHRFFSDHEFIKMHEDGFLVDESGLYLGPNFWLLRDSDEWQTDWSIYQELPTVTH